jgi:hypothetical protein
MLIIFEARYISSLNKGHYPLHHIRSLLKYFIGHQRFLSFPQIKINPIFLILLRNNVKPDNERHKQTRIENV